MRGVWFIFKLNKTLKWHENTTKVMCFNKNFFSHPDYTVGARISLAQPLNAGHGLQKWFVTVGWEFHPAPKKYYLIVKYKYITEWGNIQL